MNAGLDVKVTHDISLFLLVTIMNVQFAVSVYCMNIYSNLKASLETNVCV